MEFELEHGEEKIASMRPKPRTKTVSAAPAPSEPSAVSEPELTRLKFVRECADSSIAYVSQHALTARAMSTYARAKEASALGGAVTKLEGMIAHYGGPVVEKVAATYPVALASADARVDAAVKALGEAYDARLKNSAPMQAANAAYAYAMSAKAKYPENVETLKKARAEYLAKIEHAIEDLKARAVKLPEEAMATLKTAIAQARAALDSDKLFARVKMIWEQIVSNPTVVSVVQKATPVAEAVLAQPVVKRAVDIATPYAAAIGKRVLPKTVTA